MKTTTDPQQLIDEALGSVLRAVGISMSFYRNRIQLEGMRKAMRKVMSDAYIKGSNDNFDVMKKAGHNVAVSSGDAVKPEQTEGGRSPSA